MAKEEEKGLKEKFLKFVKENFNTIMVFLFTLQFGNFIFQYIFMKSSFLVSFTLLALFTVVFLLFKNISEEKHKALAFRMLKFAVAIFLMTLVNHFFIGLSVRLEDPEKANAVFRLSYFMNFMIGTAFVFILKNESVQETLGKVYEKDMLDTLHLAKPKEHEAGSVQICLDKETKKPVWIPYKDRFLHMLILGPTGSGKTSQAILPMVNQDMKNLEAGITVLEPKGDLAEKVYAMAEHYGRKAVYFNPLLPDCPYFNPLYGKEDDVIENIATTFRMLSGSNSNQFFLDQNEGLIRHALKVLKRLYGNEATLIKLNRLISNVGGEGRKMVTEFSRIGGGSEDEIKENADTASYFLNDYFNEKSKTYEHCSDVRTRVAKLISNKYLRRVLNPPNGQNDVDFDRYLANGDVIAISTAQGKLRDLGRFLGYFIILQLQSSVLSRPGNENTRRPHFLYIDEFQVYSNPGFGDMLTQGRSYRVASHLATQNRALIGMGSGQEGKDFVELVSTNARHVIIFPGGNALDAKYYSDQFGEELKHEVQKGITQEKFNPLRGIRMLQYDKVQIRNTEKMEARFSPTDIIYRPFGEITFVIVQNNTVQTPSAGKIQYIPKELNDKLDDMIEAYNEGQFKKEGAVNLDPVSDGDDRSTESIDSEAVVVEEIRDQSRRKKEVSGKQFYRGREIVNPNEDFLDDIVIKGQNKPKSSVSSDKKTINFESDVEDDLI